MYTISLSPSGVTVGPTGVTVNRFWEMVWEQQTPTIVMLTRCVEDGKVSSCPLTLAFIPVASHCIRI